LFVFERGSRYVALAGLELLLPQPTRAGIIARYHCAWLNIFIFNSPNWNQPECPTVSKGIKKKKTSPEMIKNELLIHTSRINFKLTRLSNRSHSKEERTCHMISSI
jgi:hypothetical protein